MSRRLPLLRAILLTVVGGSAAAAGLRWTGGALDRPERASLTAVEAWYRSVDPAQAGAAVAWAAAAALTAWLLASAALQIAAAVLGGGGLRSLADAISPRSLQRLGHGLAGLSLTAGLAAAPSAGIPSLPLQDPTEVIAEDSPEGAPGTAAASPGTATMTRLDANEPDAPPSTVAPSTTSAPGPSPSSSTTTAAPLVPPSTTVPSTPPTSPGPPSAAPGVDEQGPGSTIDEPPLAPPAQPVLLPDPTSPAPGPPVASEPVPERTIVVEPGMSFWSIAEARLSGPGGGIDERALIRYWQALVAANQDRLVAPGNADLLLPGQELVLPVP